MAPITVRRPLLLVLLLALLQSLVCSLDNGLARTPPMGWLAWTRFTCQVDCERYPDDCISAELFAQMAERLALDGWVRRGYRYIHIDDCWSEHERDSTTQRLVPDRRRFADGMQALADSVHHQSHVKLGIYGDCGTATCAGYPAQLRHSDTKRMFEMPGRTRALDAAANETQAELERHIREEATYFQLDADTFADWQIDSLKFDGCHVDPLHAETVCSRMAGALAQTGRPILLICEWPFYMMYAHAAPDFELAAASCNVWRYYDDIDGPGHWFDPDQLVVGNFGLSLGQARAQMAIWCVWAAPLYMSNDLRRISQPFVELLQNERLIAVDQDELGVFGQLVASQAEGQLQAFVKPVLPVRDGCPSFALVYLSRKTLGNGEKVAFKVEDLLLGAPIRQAAANQAEVREFARRQPSAGKKAAASHTIEVELCLERLAAGELQFEVLDLMDAGRLEAPQSVHTSDLLELWVRPSDVRAIKLQER